MKKFILSILSLSIVSIAGEHAILQKNVEVHHWSYEGENGPENWAKLNPEYFWCNLKNQSPVDISDNYKVHAKLEKLHINYTKAVNPEIVNNGHTIQVNVLEDFKLNIKGKEYHLKQFHFHAPSEHTVNGKYYPLEMHLVHKDKDGNIAVIGVFFKEGKANPELDKVFKNALKEEGSKVFDGSINLNALLPVVKNYYTYSGSLTTPPCTEGVLWIVLKQPITASKQQIELFKSIMKHNNNRPTQPINSRYILESN
ncbi:carbonic anhydrase [Sulfurihydrogenibium azorense]|uniref:carbonic anhydrase n=1 Tax=Sulfurihydrogenibium azorense TaxID=309806 RepID=UPI00240A0512|nr:carbonic anhydrase family protein [Sulfurihydrogenibium azorense]MDM7273034.1 carbonic anhydrase family protein [Sulfurihydrogenibium azorense]